MWTKDDYQEHMLGYLGSVQAEIDRLAHTSLQQHDFNELRTDLDIASELLWWLIGSSDADWEGFRYLLEASCGDLLRALHHVPYAGALNPDGVWFQPISSLVLLGTRVVQRKPEMA